jgi:hypothetical protein
MEATLAFGCGCSPECDHPAKGWRFRAVTFAQVGRGTRKQDHSKREGPERHLLTFMAHSRTTVLETIRRTREPSNKESGAVLLPGRSPLKAFLMRCRRQIPANADRWQVGLSQTESAENSSSRSLSSSDASGKVVRWARSAPPIHRTTSSLRQPKQNPLLRSVTASLQRPRLDKINRYAKSYFDRKISFNGMVIGKSS